jgi:hypothetical protein
MGVAIDDDLGGAATRPEPNPVATARASASTPVDVDTDDSPTTSTSKTLRRARATRSDKWQDMEQFNNHVEGKEVRVAAICNYYKSRLSAPSMGGMGHLHRHIKVCKKKTLAGSSSSQSHLHFGSNGNVQKFQYNPNTTRSELTHLIARLELPLNIGEQPTWGDYIRNAHNPNYKQVSMQTTTRDVEALFYRKQSDVKQLLEQASCVCLTSDIWSGLAKEYYLSVLFHFVTDD